MYRDAGGGRDSISVHGDAIGKGGHGEKPSAGDTGSVVCISSVMRSWDFAGGIQF